VYLYESPTHTHTCSFCTHFTKWKFTWFQEGGPYVVELGRLDGRVSTKASVRHHLPPPDFKPEQLNQMFASLSLW